MDPTSTIPQDANDARVAAGIDTTDPTKVLPFEVDPVTGRLLVDAAIDVSALATLAEQQTQTTHLADIKTAVELIDNAIAGNEMQVDVITLPALPAGTNNIGDVDVLTLPALATGTNRIGKVELTDGTDDADILESSATPGVFGLVVVNADGSAVAGGGGGGGGTEYTEDAATPANPTAGGLSLRRRDALAGETTADGDWVTLNGTDKGEMYVKHVDAIPVTDNGGTLTVDGTVTANLSAVDNAVLDTIDTSTAASAVSLAIIDDWDESDRAKVNLIVGQAGITAGAGAVAANTPRVTHASDDPVTVALQLIDNAISGNEMQVDVVAALPTGSNIIGALVANQSVNVAQMNATTVLMGNGNSGTGAQRVTIAADSTGQVASVGKTAADAAIAAAPVTTGGRASTATPASMSADGDVVNLWLDRAGATIISGYVAQDAAVAGNPVLGGGRASAAEPTAMTADGDSVYSWMDRRGRQIVAFQAGTGTQTSVGSSATNVTLLAANTSRKGAILFNDSTQICYVRFAATATSSNFTYKMVPGATLEVPFGYTGIIDGIWASANGNMRVTEIA